MEILKFPHPSLKTVCSEVTVFGPELKILLEAMWETMKNAKGIGLAANQVGLSQRMFVMEGPNEEKIFAVNPMIIRKGLNVSTLKEGCLSFPGEVLYTRSRYDFIEVRYQDENGKLNGWTLSGIYSVAFQHELDHINGITFIESKGLPREKRRYLAKKWKLK